MCLARHPSRAGRDSEHQVSNYSPCCLPPWEGSGSCHWAGTLEQPILRYGNPEWAEPALVGLLLRPCLRQALTLVVKKMSKASVLELACGEAVLTFLGPWYPCKVPTRGLGCGPRWLRKDLRRVAGEPGVEAGE